MSKIDVISAKLQAESDAALRDYYEQAAVYPDEAHRDYLEDCDEREELKRLADCGD